MPKRTAKISASRGLIGDLVAASRILAMHEVLDAYGHVSARSDRRPECFVMSRALAPALVTAADLMELDACSEALRGDRRKGFIERYIHGEIYRSRPEVMAIVHSHSASVIPFGVTRSATFLLLFRRLGGLFTLRGGRGGLAALHFLLLFLLLFRLLLFLFLLLVLCDGKAAHG